ncbi:hypothetical protein GCM10009811_15510 [Nostocoides veronense]|uniref:Uncharacterized protein n=1 Tax=Nostocoides veronense TaxID=330836 RepID=A0ABP4XUB3_9MICO
MPPKCVNDGLRVKIELVQEEDIRMHGFKVVAVHLIRREVLEIERDDDLALGVHSRR